MMFGVSLPELIVVMVVMLIAFGPEKLPETARSVGKIMGMLRKNADQVRREFYNAIYPPAEELRKELEAPQRDLRAIKKEIVHEIYEDKETPEK